MIGDLILWFRLKWKQMFCIHDYETKVFTTRPYRDYRKCKRCKKLG